MLTLEQAQNLAMLTQADIIKVYSGRPNSRGNHCRCGCQGTYRYASDIDILKDRGYAGDASEVNDRQVAKVLGIVQAHAADAETEADHGWFDATVNGRSYTIYVKEGF